LARVGAVSVAAVVYAVVDPDQPSPRVVVIVVVVQMAVRPNADMERPYHKRAPSASG